MLRAPWLSARGNPARRVQAARAPGSGALHGPTQAGLRTDCRCSVVSGIMKKCVILQPSYIPWRGVFHQIYKSDIFVFYDDVQYDKHGWRNRNRVKTPKGPQWLTIPVHKKGNVEHQRAIQEIEICWERPWNKRHHLTL